MFQCQEVSAISYVIDNDSIIVDTITGEICHNLSEGSLILTSEDLQRQQAEKQRIRESAQKRTEKEITRYRGKREKFYFMLSEQSLNLSPVDATRLIYLSTYVGYNTDQLLSGYKGKKMKRSDLPQILDVSADTADRFWQAVTGEYIIEDADGYLHVNSDWIFRGRIRDYRQYQQFYDTAIRKLYRSATRESRKKIGYIFNLLPYINREWNVLSVNPDETDLDSVQPMSITEFCERTGLDKSHIKRTLQQFRSIRFKTDKGLERLISIVNDGSAIVINPNILYVGTNINRVKVYTLFFKDI